MIIKKSKVKIVDVIKDDEHDIDDEGTRDAMKRASDELEQEKKGVSKKDMVN